MSSDGTRLFQSKRSHTLPIDTLPVELDIKLRVNRLNLALADTHGQIWMQLASASERDPKLFSPQQNKNKKILEKRMLDILCLGGEARFPVSRLVTLWRNDRWNPMITRWCRTHLGKSLFNISVWDRMASYRIDDVSPPSLSQLSRHFGKNGDVGWRNL